MKKCIALVLSLGLLLTLLAGCEMFAPDQMQTPNYALGGNETGSPGGPAENGETGVDEYGFTVFPEGNYLADKKFDTDEFLPDYDADPSFIQFLSKSFYALCRTEDTFYSNYSKSGKTKLIMFTDKATGISSPLCGRPECLHRDSKCNAYVANRADGLCVYDGKLYWVNGMSNITRMNLDGTGRETVAPVGSAYNNANDNKSVVFHRGYLYVAGSQSEVIRNGVAMSAVTVNAMPLDGGENFTILDRLLDGSSAECLIKPVGNDLYIMVYYYNHEHAYDTVEFYRWDSKTRQVKFISSTQSYHDILDLGKESFHPVPGDGIYFQAYIRIDKKQNNVIYKYSFETNTYEEGVWLNGYSELFYCKDFIVGKAGKVVYTFDYDGNPLSQSDPVEGQLFGNFVGADSEFAYYSCVATENYFAVPLNGGNVIAIG